MINNMQRIFIRFCKEMNIPRPNDFCKKTSTYYGTWVYEVTRQYMPTVQICLVNIIWLVNVVLTNKEFIITSDEDFNLINSYLFADLKILRNNKIDTDEVLNNGLEQAINFYRQWLK